jgi:hypothetical protein
MTRPRQRAETDPLTPILELVDLTRELATPHDDNAAWIAAEAGQRTGGTGTYSHGRRTASAGQYAAHAIRLATLNADQTTKNEPWNAELLKQTAAINSWDWDTRMQGALNLRATYLGHDNPEPPTLVPVKLVGTWLTHTTGDQFVQATARLAQYVLDHDELHPYLRPAWYATHAGGSGVTMDTNDMTCINLNSEKPCSGTVEPRWPLSGTGIRYPRCDYHWGLALERENQTRRRYPTHPPADWSPMDAGETWYAED